MANFKQIPSRVLETFSGYFVVLAAGQFRKGNRQIRSCYAPVKRIKAVSQRRECIEDTDGFGTGQKKRRAQRQAGYKVHKIGFQFAVSQGDVILLPSQPNTGMDTPRLPAAGATGLISMISIACFRRYSWIFCCCACLTVLPTPAGYKPRPWTPRPIDSYQSRLTSEGVTIAVEPLFSDALAAKVFDKSDIVARGIMPLAIVVFNSNDFPVEVEASSVELLLERERLQPLPPDQAVQRMYRDQPKMVSRPSIPGIPRIKINRLNDDIVQDFQRKYLGIKKIGPQVTDGGFLYFPLKSLGGVADRLAAAKVYIPHVHRTDSGADLLFFEIDLRVAVDAAPRK